MSGEPTQREPQVDVGPALRSWPRVAGMYTIVIVILVVLSLLVFEVYHRIVLRQKILAIMERATLWVQNHTLVPGAEDEFFHRNVEVHPKGLFKVNTTIDIAVVNPTQGTLNFSVQTNNIGLLSERPYRLERDPEHPEYRIVVLGDSMTGPTTATYQWVDTVEELLNASQELRAAVGHKEFRVYNLGWVAAGFQTFWKAYERSGRYFDPDLTVVNFIEIDLERTDGPHLKTEPEMISHAKAHMDKLFAVQRKVLFTLMPIYNEMIPTVTEYERTPKLEEADPRIKPVVMRDRLPVHLGREEIEGWFNVPHDAHLSDRGGEMYARALAGVIAERISGKNMDFTKVPSKHGGEVLGPGTPRTRKIDTALSHWANDQEAIMRIKSFIRGEMLAGKVYGWYPYSVHALMGMGTDGLTIPYTKPLTGGTQPVPFGPRPEDVVHLTMVCSSLPISLRNPECYHHFHMFVK